MSSCVQLGIAAKTLRFRRCSCGILVRLLCFRFSPHGNTPRNSSHNMRELRLFNAVRSVGELEPDLPLGTIVVELLKNWWSDCWGLRGLYASQLGGVQNAIGREIGIFECNR